LTTASTNTVKITCPVIHADTGASADDRVRGNAAGYSIILGSPATAESAGLAQQIISGLGGASYLEAEASQMALKTLIEQVTVLVTEVKAKTDTTPTAEEIRIEIEGEPHKLNKTMRYAKAARLQTL
jgi:hypothetical protein